MVKEAVSKQEKSEYQIWTALEYLVIGLWIFILSPEPDIISKVGASFGVLLVLAIILQYFDKPRKISIYEKIITCIVGGLALTLIIGAFVFVSFQFANPSFSDETVVERWSLISFQRPVELKEITGIEAIKIKTDAINNFKQGVLDTGGPPVDGNINAKVFTYLSSALIVLEVENVFENNVEENFKEFEEFYFEEEGQSYISHAMLYTCGTSMFVLQYTYPTNFEFKGIPQQTHDSLSCSIFVYRVPSPIIKLQTVPV